MYKELKGFEDALPISVPDDLQDLDSRLQIFKDEKLEIWYAPLGETQNLPEVWILGITPGWQQMKISYEEAAKCIRNGMPSAEAAKAEKPTVAFAGPMRSNLISMLNDLGLQNHMGIDSTSDLFESNRLRTGSVLRYPVFRKGKNYSGSSPDPLKHIALRAMIDEVLIEELKTVNNCLIVPLGTAVDKVLDHCVNEEFVEPKRILSGFPHPSGGNGYRVRHFNERKEALALQLNNWFS